MRIGKYLLVDKIGFDELNMNHTEKYKNLEQYRAKFSVIAI
jgi:hypothetical protein